VSIIDLIDQCYQISVPFHNQGSSTLTFLLSLSLWILGQFLCCVNFTNAEFISLLVTLLVLRSSRMCVCVSLRLPTEGHINLCVISFFCVYLMIV